MKQQKSSGNYVIIQPSPQSVPIINIGDQNSNVGPFVLSISQKSNLTLLGFVLASSTIAAGEMLRTWGEVTGNETEYIEVGLGQFDSL